jgi:hypothetical protein
LYNFHHRNPCEKEFIISHKTKEIFDSLKSELNKCDLLCSNCHREQHPINKYLAIKRKYADYLGGKCQDCFNENIIVLEFHHRNPNDKKFDISRRKHKTSWKTITKELDKCDLLCANCHREKHYK